MRGCGKGGVRLKNMQKSKVSKPTAKIINNYFPSAGQENNYFMKLLVNADVWKATPRY
jgi:hypothetical protein